MQLLICSQNLPSFFPSQALPSIYFFSLFASLCHSCALSLLCPNWQIRQNPLEHFRKYRRPRRFKIKGRSVEVSSSVVQTQNTFRTRKSSELEDLCPILILYGFPKLVGKLKEMKFLIVRDDSGNTTVFLWKKGEDTNVISLTMGFNIKTIIKYQRYLMVK